MAEEVPSPFSIAPADAPAPPSASAFAPSTLRGWSLFQQAVNHTLPDALAKSKQARQLALTTLSRIG